MHACMHAYIHTYIHTFTHIYIHTYIRTYIHTCVHTDVHTYHMYDIYIMYLYKKKYMPSCLAGSGFPSKMISRKLPKPCSRLSGLRLRIRKSSGTQICPATWAVYLVYFAPMMGFWGGSCWSVRGSAECLIPALVVPTMCFKHVRLLESWRWIQWCSGGSSSWLMFMG